MPFRWYVHRPRSAVRFLGAGQTAAAVIYFHGGAFLLGDLEIEHPRCLEMAKETKAVVIAVDYRLAPEHPFPAAITDCHAVYLWAMAEADELGIDVSRIAIAGASAGGALAAAVGPMSRDRWGSRAGVSAPPVPCN